MKCTGSQFRDKINYLYLMKNTGSVGKLGEAIFADIFIKSGHKVETLHSGGVDFMVDGVELWDVKTRKNINTDFGTDFSLERKKQNDVNYGYVIFYKDAVGFAMERANGEPMAIQRLTWEQALIHANFDCSTLSKSKHFESQKSEIKAVKASLKLWVENTLGLRARILHRSGRAYQDSMENAGWGADSFYVEDGSGYDIVVLIFFDAGRVYKVYAYQTEDKHRIDWKPKALQSQSSKSVYCFDPRSLDSEFVFSSIQQFQDGFLVTHI